MLKIGIIQGSAREENNGSKVAAWINDYAQKRGDAEYELVDLRDYNLPLLGSKYRADDADAHIQAWSEKMASFDGYIFITPEYNHSISGAFKNATDYLKAEVANKAAGFVGYGSLGGTRAHENLRLILGELQVADVRTAVTFSLMSDFVNMSEFKPADYHQPNVDAMFDQVLLWSKALKAIR